jgi:hypothetical protein
MYHLLRLSLPDCIESEKAWQVHEISPLDCRHHSAECLRLREQAGISVQEATILLTMARTWTAMANHKERLASLQRDSRRDSIS